MTTLAVISTAASSADATGGANVASMLTMLIPLALIIVFFYFFIIRPEKKRNKEMQNMLNSIQVADEVITNGGIIGRVLSVKEDTVLIETGSDEAGGEAVLRDTAYSAYTLVSSVGKQRVDKLNYTSGQPASEVHLVAVLEQLTYIEQPLAALGVQI